MRTLGFFLALLGATSFLFPLINMQSMIMKHFGEHEQIAAIASIAVGVVLFGLSFRRKKEKKT